MAAIRKTSARRCSVNGWRSLATTFWLANMPFSQTACSRGRVSSQWTRARYSLLWIVCVLAHVGRSERGLQDRHGRVVDLNLEVVDRDRWRRDLAHSDVAGSGDGGPDAGTLEQIAHGLAVLLAVAGRHEPVAPHVVPVAMLVLSDGDEEIVTVPRGLLLAAGAAGGFKLWIAQPGSRQVLPVAVLQVLEEEYVERHPIAPHVVHDLFWLASMPAATTTSWWSVLMASGRSPRSGW